jgi:hypothetical protein
LYTTSTRDGAIDVSARALLPVKAHHTTRENEQTNSDLTAGFIRDKSAPEVRVDGPEAASK